MSENTKICGHCAHIDKDGKCRQFGESRGYFEMRTCFEEPATVSKTENVAPTKVCRICGRTLPLDQFPKHPRTPDKHYTICSECIRAKNADSIRKAADASHRKGSKRGPYKQGTVETKPAPAVESKPLPPADNPRLRPDLHVFTDRQLYNELTSRGYTGTLTRIITLQAPDEL